MSDHVHPQQSFFSIAAWYSLLAPVIAGIALVLLGSLGFFSRFDSPGIDPDTVLSFMAVVLLSSVVMSIISLFGIRRHGARVILWKAALGILVSCIFYVGVAGFGLGRLCHQ
jgi:hypothetical protein